MSCEVSSVSRVRRWNTGGPGGGVLPLLEGCDIFLAPPTSLPGAVTPIIYVIYSILL